MKTKLIKVCYILVVCTVILTSISQLDIFATTYDDIELYMDGERVEANLFIRKDRLLAPLKEVAEKLGAEVKWDGISKWIDIYSEKGLITIMINDKRSIIFGEIIEMDVTPRIFCVDGEYLIYVPIRFIAENLGAIVDYNPKTRTVGVISKEIQQINNVDKLANSNYWSQGFDTPSDGSSYIFRPLYRNDGNLLNPVDEIFKAYLSKSDAQKIMTKVNNYSNETKSSVVDGLASIIAGLLVKDPKAGVFVEILFISNSVSQSLKEDNYDNLQDIISNMKETEYIEIKLRYNPQYENNMFQNYYRGYSQVVNLEDIQGYSYGVSQYKRLNNLTKSELNNLKNALSLYYGKKFTQPLQQHRTITDTVIIIPNPNNNYDSINSDKNIQENEMPIDAVQPTIRVRDITLKNNTMIIDCKIKDLGSIDFIQEYGIKYKKVEDLDFYEYNLGNTKYELSYSYTITGLEDNQEYEFLAYVKSELGVVESEVNSVIFVNDNYDVEDQFGPPCVTMVSYENLTKDGVLLKARLDALGQQTVTTIGFKILDKDTGSKKRRSLQIEMTTTGEYEYYFDELISGHRYLVWTYAENASGSTDSIEDFTFIAP